MTFLAQKLFNARRKSSNLSDDQDLLLLPKNKQVNHYDHLVNHSYGKYNMELVETLDVKFHNAVALYVAVVPSYDLVQLICKIQKD